MKRRMPPLNHLRAFEAAARHESFTKAADELNVTQGAISRHIRTLEEHIGHELFDRSTSTLRLLESGRRFAKVLTRAFDEIHEGAREFDKDSRKTVLTVHSYPNFSLRWLLPRLPEFMALQPDIEVRLLNGTRAPSDLARDGIDVAIRCGHGVWDGIQSEHLFEFELLPCCSPSLAKSQEFKAPKDLLEATLLESTLYESYFHKNPWPAWFSSAGTTAFLPKHEIRYEDPIVTHQCALAGMGVSLTQRLYMIDDVAAGRLVIPFDIPLKKKLNFYLTYSHKYDTSRKITAFRDWIVPLVQGHRAHSNSAPRQDNHIH